ncbi:PSD1 and planctomycete cytochrome C domain-containing protein [Anatilimnocola floriformis]|uniref:PSD1 and planctomycete cytochrome C domain-containing protein n=1 Tax=Anatilimnocola floriformis TaxID=2948575 RepID=UPI0020C4B7A2|nr:PSD1 and planctomycete cytochrome C domain-containing protein [Anatilimnocola floriformis]
MPYSFTLSGWLLLALPLAVAAEPLQFNRDIRPILADKCFYCHGQDANQRQGDLRLDDRDAAIKAKAFVPRDLKASTLIERINSTDAETLMPPPKSNRTLTADQKKLLERWIAEGAEYETHWAYVAPQRPAPPTVANDNWTKNPIDRFVLQKLQAAGMQPSPEAEKSTLIKRLSIDLIGLPPTPEEVAAFVADNDPRSYERLVDRLLASRHYGERMALPWLDAARYADSNGFQQDGDTWQWIWRDWLVQALNDDLPFDQFTIWQLAGDLLPKATTEQKIASGFNRNHLLNGEGGAIAEEQRFVNLFDRIDTTATTWLGLTMACAQCHDHKYDPITRRDYYSLMDAFNRVPETGTPQRQSSRIRVAAPFLELPSEENKAKLAELEAAMKGLENEAKPVIDATFLAWRTGLFADGEPADGKDLPRNLTPLLRKPVAERTAEDNKSIESQLRSFFDNSVKAGVVAKLPQVVKYEAARKAFDEYKGDKIPRVMVMSDERQRETSILDRGEYLRPLEKVSFTTPQFLPPLAKDSPTNRLGLAQWLVAPEHPLTARVQVNRMWQHFFGVGLLKTAEDFGVQSEFPLHKDLLDWLAVEFRENGWSPKKMHRLIVTSATYRQASRVTEQHRQQDADNRLLARASRFRMPSLLLRDWALATSGLIETRLGGAPVYPYQPDAVWEALAITKERDFTYPTSSGKDLYRRSLYTFWRRTVGPANMFDASNRQTCRVRASATSTPLHALTTLNDPTWVEAARVLAARTLKDGGELDAQLAGVFRRVLCREAKSSEINRLKAAYEKQLVIYRADAEAAKSLLSVGAAPREETLDAAQHAAMTAVCLGILNLDEALTRE